MAGLLRVAVGLACVALLAAGMSPLPAPSAAAAGQTVTSVTLVGESGAFLGHNEAHVFSPATGGTVRLSGDPRDLELELSTGRIGYTVRLAAPLDQELAPGTYGLTSNYPQVGSAGLDVHGQGSACNESPGRLVVLDISHHEDTVDRLHALFEFHCEGVEPAVFGEIRYRMPSGGDPGLSAAPGRVDWPLTHSDVPARPVPVTFSNTGEAPLRLAAPELSGEHSSAFEVHDNGCRAELAVGDTCEVHVRFVPASGGPHFASLTVEDLTGARTQSVALTGVAATGTTAWQLRSEPGDPVGGGQSYDWTPGNAVITAGGNGWHVAVSADSPDGHYTAVFAGDGEALRPGTYERTLPYGSGEPGAELTVARSDRRCEASTGRFTVKEITVDGQRLERFAATFEQRCHGVEAALSGSVSYRAGDAGPAARTSIGSAAAAPLTGTTGETTAVRLRSQPGDPFLEGRSYDWTPAEAEIHFGGSEALVRVDIEAGEDYFGAYFNPGRNDVLLPGRTYSRARRAGFSYPYPGLWINGAGVGCNTIFGSFTVHEVAYGVEGLQRFSASFEQYCEGAEVPMVGTVAYRARRPPPMPGEAPPPARFSDIAGSVHERNIVLVADEQITAGYPDGTYRPALPVNRGQLASFLARALDLPPAPSRGFSDTAGSVHAAAIDTVAAAGIAAGYPDGSFRPDVAVTRAQMASFLTRALDLPPGAPGTFSDTAGDAHETAIDSVAARGIAAGYSNGTYAPGEPVNRAHMATFLVRALGLDGRR